MLGNKLRLHCHVAFADSQALRLLGLFAIYPFFRQSNNSQSNKDTKTVRKKLHLKQRLDIKLD